jgi:purine-binding chemotaxis protein CheW
METLASSVQQFDSAKGPVPAEAQVRVCLVSLGGELFAIDLHSVSEVFEVGLVTPVPGMPQVLVGVANLRGLVIPLVDLRSLLGLPATGPTLPYAVVVRHGAQLLALLVERVPEIQTIQRDQFLPAVQNAQGNSKSFVTAVLCIEDRMGGVLEIPTVFEQVEGKGVYALPMGTNGERVRSGDLEQ